MSLPIRPARPWQVVDLFSGCGGMSSGFRRLPEYFQIVAAVDKEAGKPGLGKSPPSTTFCNATYHRNIGIAPFKADLLHMRPSDLRERVGLAPGALDVMIACPPCTGFSQKNARNHIEDDPRNMLVERTSEFVSEFMPEFVVMENVKELLQGNQRHHFTAFRRALESKGYSLSAEVHDLATFGLPQRRMRALIVARRDGPVIGLPRRGMKLRTVRDAIGHLPHVAAGERHPSDAMHVSPSMTAIVSERLRAIPKNGGSWADVMNDANRSLEEKKRLLIPAMFRARPGSFPDVYGRLWWDRPAITVTRECGHVGNGRYTHPEQDRLLTVREMAVIQGFPEDYVFSGPLSSRYNQIGDAVPPLIAELVARHVSLLKSNLYDVHDMIRGQAVQLSLLERRGEYAIAYDPGVEPVGASSD
ncbi:MAG: DNA cytosine methyltransferase [Chloroflexi bacterium]|nr:DNA cytosine methyltransferase [Chloroflexota bacterium]